LIRFKNEIQETKYLKKILDQKWFQEIETQINNLRRGEEYSTSTRTLFIKYEHVKRRCQAKKATRALQLTIQYQQKIDELYDEIEKNFIKLK
jgi:hypothetical protein